MPPLPSQDVCTGCQCRSERSFAFPPATNRDRENRNTHEMKRRPCANFRWLGLGAAVRCTSSNSARLHQETGRRPRNDCARRAPLKSISNSPSGSEPLERRRLSSSLQAHRRTGPTRKITRRFISSTNTQLADFCPFQRLHQVRMLISSIDPGYARARRVFVISRAAADRHFLRAPNEIADKNGLLINSSAPSTMGPVFSISLRLARKMNGFLGLPLPRSCHRAVGHRDPACDIRRLSWLVVHDFSAASGAVRPRVDRGDKSLIRESRIAHCHRRPDF